MQHLYYCRHGQSTSNLNHLWGGHTDSELTEQGYAQAHSAGAGLRQAGTHIDLIISSPLKRAHNTAIIIAEEIGYPVDNIVIDERFIERSFGVLDGQPDNPEWLTGAGYKNLDNIEGAENVEHVQQRAAAALDYLKTLPQENILVVGHGAFGRGLLRTIHGQPYSDEFTLQNITEVIPNAKVLQLL